MKKHALSILVVLISLLCCPVQAESFYSIQTLRQQAAEGWHQTYEAYGREIAVDVDIIVPNVSVLPVYTMCFAASDVPQAKETTTLVAQGRVEDNVVWFNTPYFPEPEPGRVDKLPYAVFASPKEMDRAYAPGNDLTLSQAIALVRDSLATFGYQPDDFALDNPYRLSTFHFVDAKTQETIDPGEYYLYFYQQVDEIPLLCHAGMAFQKRDSRYYSPGMTANVVASDALNVVVEMLKPEQEIAADIPLCPLGTVMNALEAEIQNGHIRKVFQLQLGFVLYDDPDYTAPKTFAGHYYAVPAWQLNCLYESDAEKDIPNSEDEDVFEADSLAYATIVINAQTGEMLDYLRTDKDRAAYPGFLTWDDAGGKQ
ncbi:MAG: hypothetical protein PHY64_00490 [Eubacteriales bacterium]|nr:hypothetical protein [Eubacteriales bacterium]